MPRLKLPTPEQLNRVSVERREAAAAAILHSLDLSGRVSRPLFDERARWPMPTVDVVPLIHDKDSGTFRVLLARRPLENDPWPGQYHITGSAMLGVDYEEEYGEQDCRKIVGRIAHTEWRNSLAITDGPYEMYTRQRSGVRGPEMTTFLVAGVEQQDEPPERTALFPAPGVAENPPEGGLIIGHAQTIIRAVKLYGDHLSGERRLLHAYDEPL